MVLSFRPLSRVLPLASRAALYSTCSAASARPVALRASGAASKLVASPSRAGQRFLPSSVRALTTAREKVKVLLVTYDGGQHARDVSVYFCFPLSQFDSGPKLAQHHAAEDSTDRDRVLASIGDQFYPLGDPHKLAGTLVSFLGTGS